MAAVRITEFTDPACPWAYSAEPFRRRLDWLYGDALEWDVRMVGLSDSPEHYLEMGFTPEQASRPPSGASPTTTACRSTPPCGPAWRPRCPACRAVVAARRNAPDRMRAAAAAPAGAPLLAASCSTSRRPSTAPPRDAGHRRPPTSTRWIAGAGDRGGAARRHGRRARGRCRRPSCSTTRLANWSGGRRYTCPSYEIERLADGVRIAVPGFQPFAVYDVIMANLVPGIRRADPPASVGGGARAGPGTPARHQGGRRRPRHPPRGRPRGARPGGATRSTWAPTGSGPSP